MSWSQRVSQYLPASTVGIASHLRRGALYFRDARALAPVLREVRELVGRGRLAQVPPIQGIGRLEGVGKK